MYVSFIYFAACLRAGHPLPLRGERTLRHFVRCLYTHILVCTSSTTGYLNVCILNLSCTHIVQRNRLARPHRHRGLASDGVRYAGARSSVGRRFRSVTKPWLEWYGGVFLLLQQRSKHPREMIITPKASTLSFVVQRVNPVAISQEDEARALNPHPSVPCLQVYWIRVRVTPDPNPNTRSRSWWRLLKRKRRGNPTVKTRDGNVAEPGVEPTFSVRTTGHRTADLKGQLSGKGG